MYGGGAQSESLLSNLVIHIELGDNCGTGKQEVGCSVAIYTRIKIMIQLKIILPVPTL